MVMWLRVCLKYNILIFTVTSNGDSLKIIQISVAIPVVMYWILGMSPCIAEIASSKERRRKVVRLD